MEYTASLKISLDLLTDSKSLFEVIEKSSITTEVRLMIDILAARKVFEKNENDDFGWIRTEDTIPDWLTIEKGCSAFKTTIRHWNATSKSTAMD